MTEKLKIKTRHEARVLGYREEKHTEQKRTPAYLDDGTKVYETTEVEVVERIPVLAGSPTVPARVDPETPTGEPTRSELTNLVRATSARDWISGRHPSQPKVYGPSTPPPRDYAYPPGPTVGDLLEESRKNPVFERIFQNSRKQKGPIQRIVANLDDTIRTLTRMNRKK